MKYLLHCSGPECHNFIAKKSFWAKQLLADGVTSKPRYCSHSCKTRAYHASQPSIPEGICLCENPQCQKVLVRKLSRIAKNQHNFCSTKCRSIVAKQVTTQICTLCKDLLPATLEYFNKGNRANGLQSACKPCQKQRSDEWYVTHREEHLRNTKINAQAHPARRRLAVRNYRLRHPERKKLQAQQTREKRRANGKAKADQTRRTQSGRQAQATKRYHEKHPEAKKIIHTKHKKKLAEQGLTLHSRWKKNHPDSVANKNRIGTIGRQQMRENGITAIAIYERDGGKCHLCHRLVSRRTFSLDHIIPKSVGGPGTWENLALAHLRCNVKRGVGKKIPAQMRLF